MSIDRIIDRIEIAELKIRQVKSWYEAVTAGLCNRDPDVAATIATNAATRGPHLQIRIDELKAKLKAG